jgi:hypothetical protein
MSYSAPKAPASVMSETDIETLSNCDGMLDILEKAVENLQAMPSALHQVIVKASALRKERNKS